jgi:dual specificity MAP kinase phosphatase
MVFTRAMHLSRPHLDTSGPEHGLTYDPSFLPALPILVARPAPHTPVRAITAAEFAEIHLRAQTTHAPDSSIFPFLHGLEGDNIAQNTFFAADATDGQGRLRLPRFRGLIWVAADEGDSDHSDDDDDEPLSSDDESSEYSDEFDPATHCAAPTEDTFGMHMDVDADAEPLTATDPNSPPHMHPVAHRPPFRPSPSGATVTATKVHATTHGPTDILDFAFPPQAHPHDRRPSNASSTSSLSNSTSSLFDAASVSSASTPPASPAARGSKLPSTHQHHAHSPARHHPRPRKMPLFTSSFKPREILKPGPAGTLEPAFIDAIVPPGISLRNFGIQVVRYTRA